MGAAVIGDLFNSTVRDPEQVERTLKAEVVGSLPVVKELRDRIAQLKGQPTMAPQKKPTRRRKKTQR